jgi:hypothetical protein
LFLGTILVIAALLVFVQVGPAIVGDRSLIEFWCGLNWNNAKLRRSMKEAFCATGNSGTGRNCAWPVTGLPWQLRKHIVGMAPEADNHQSFGVSVRATAAIAGIVCHSLIAMVRLLVISYRVALLAAGLLSNWHSPLHGGFYFLDFLSSTDLMRTWVMGSDDWNEQIRHFVSDWWLGLFSSIRFEGQGDMRRLFWICRLVWKGRLLRCGSALAFAQISIIHTRSEFVCDMGNGRSSTRLKTDFGRAIGFMIGTKWALGNLF